MKMLLLWLFAVSLLAQSANLLEQADEAFRQGDLNRAAILARQALTRDPGAAHGHMILGVIAAQKSQWDASNRHFEAVVRLEPSSPYGYFYLGQARLYQRRWEEAIKFFSQALKFNYPEHERLVIEMATAQNEAGRPEEALSSLGGIEPADPALAAQFHAVTAFAQARLYQSAAAIEAIRRALQVDDSSVHYWEFLIRELIKIDESSQALAEAIRAQKKFPDDPDIQFLFALTSYYVSESPLTGLALRNLREADASSPRVQLAEGLLYRKQGKMEAASSAFRMAADRGVPDAHLLLGIVFRENGDYAAAEWRSASCWWPEASWNKRAFGSRRRPNICRMPPPFTISLGLSTGAWDKVEKAQRHLKLSRQSK